MTAEEILKSSESSALNHNQIISHVTGKNTIKKGKKLQTLGAAGLITAMLAVFAVLFSSGNLIPSAISERLIEETDVQYADAVESKKLVFQQAMYDGSLPDNTVEILGQHGVSVEKKKNGEQFLVMGEKNISAASFINEVNADINLYNAFNEATYSRAAYYYDDAAKEVFRKIGTTRNNYNNDSDFDKTMDSLLGEGNRIELGNVIATEKKEGDASYIDYVLIDNPVKSDIVVDEYIKQISQQNTASSASEAILNTADTLKAADTISKEQRSKIFFLALMENISKMKAGEGNDAKINEALNYLNETSENEVIDIKTGEPIKTTGTALEAPSLYAILTDSKVSLEEVSDYSSDRILKTIENRINKQGSQQIVSNTVVSADTNLRGSIGRLITSRSESASLDDLKTINLTVNQSLINNSYKTIKGISAGEFLVEGAVNVGKDLAKASGATAGDENSVKKYARLNLNIIAMDRAIDRLNRSPFDITSKNTFLGSIIYKLAINNLNSSPSFLSNIKTVAKSVNNSFLSLITSTYADDENNYLTEFGDCETINLVGAVGSPHCSEIATFDTSTLNDPFNDSKFIEFVNNNTTLDSTGKRIIKDGSLLAKFILYNNERSTPLGIMDGGILNSLNEERNSIFFVSNIAEMIKTFLESSDQSKRIATGAEFINSDINPNWGQYKYAQRYVSLARATDSLRQYAGDTTAYTNIRYFEGNQNPVIAFLNHYYNIADN